MKKARGQRPDGLVQVSTTIDGKRKYFYGKTRKEAKEKAAAAKYAAAESKKVEPCTLTVAEWVSLYLETYRTKVNPAYIINDNIPYNRLAAALGTRQLASVSEADLQTTLNDLSGMSFSTCRNYRQVIRRVFGKAHKNRLIAYDPSADIKLPSYTKGTHRALEPWEISVITNHWNAPKQCAGLWIMIMLYCGLRRGEMMALDWKDIDLAAGTLSVTQTAVVKGNQTIIERRAKTEAGIRVIPICAALRKALESVPPSERTGFVCLSAHGTQLSECAVRRGLAASLSVWSQISGRELSIRAHDLRHTYATMLYESGADVKVAQYLLGHADIKMTLQLYTHLSNSHKEDAMKSVTDYLDSLTTT